MTAKQIYDYIIVGSGPGGATVAKELAEKKKKVLIVEYGPRFTETGEIKVINKVFLDKEEQMLPIISYIGENLNCQISIEELANIACMSASNFHSFFRKKMEISPMKFIKKMRLEEASFKLARTHNPISTIAEDLGFSSQFHFSRDFKSHYNITPSEYRAFYWKGDVLGNTEIK